MIPKTGHLRSRSSRSFNVRPGPRPDMDATEREIREFCQEPIAYHEIPQHARFVMEFPAPFLDSLIRQRRRGD